MKILLVEDDISLSRMYATRFSLAGFEVITAYNGEDGLKFAIEQNPDIVLVDLMLPKLNGEMLIKKLHDNASTSIVPIIVLSNLAQPGKPKDLASYGVKEYLVKAMYTPEQVVEIVNRYIQKS